MANHQKQYVGETGSFAPHVATAAQRLPLFVEKNQGETASLEWARLVSLGIAPNYLSQFVTEWAKQNPEDPRIPEALHLAVRSTRYGCTDKETGKFSRAAFELLHQRYPKSLWAKKTPYWYSGE
jgi:hypothetical protein